MTPLLSYWSKTSPTLATLTPLCQTVLRHSPLRSREALPTSQVHHTIPPPMVLPNVVWFRHSSSTLEVPTSTRAAPRNSDTVSPTPRSKGYSPSKLLNGRQIRTKIAVLLPSPAHAAQGKQAREATVSSSRDMPQNHHQ